VIYNRNMPWNRLYMDVFRGKMRIVGLEKGSSLSYIARLGAKKSDIGPENGCSWGSIQ